MLGATTAEVHLSIGQRGFPDRRVFPPSQLFYMFKKKRMLEVILIRWDVGSAHETGPSESSLPHESRRGSRHRAVVHWRLRQHHLQERHRPIRPLYRRASSCHRRQPLTRQGGRAPRCSGGSARRLDSASFRYDGTAHCQARPEQIISTGGLAKAIKSCFKSRICNSYLCRGRTVSRQQSGWWALATLHHLCLLLLM